MSDITATLTHKFDNLKEHLKNASSRSQIETILGELSSLQSEAASYGLNFDISNLKENAETRIKNLEVEQAIDRSRAQEEEFLKSQRAAKLAEEEKEIAQRIAVLNNFHNEFTHKSTTRIKEIEKSNIHLDHIHNKLATEHVINHEELNSYILTHEEISEQHKEHKELYEHQRKANEEHAHINSKIDGLNKEITNLKQQLQKKDLTPEEIKELKEKLEFQQEMLKLQQPYAKQLNKTKKETDQKIIEYEKAKKAQGDKIKKLGANIKMHHEKDPTQYSESYDKYKVLKNQHKAIERDGIVKDTEHHNKVIDKINMDKTRSLADKMREQTQVKDNNIGSLSPSRTPNINSTNNKTREI